MKAFWFVFLTSLQNNFVYRANFFITHLRRLLAFLTPLFVWLSVFAHQTTIYHYSLNQLLTYIFGAMILQTLIFDSHTYELGSLINNGNLSLLLLKPISISLYFLSQDLADKALNAFMLLLEIGLLLLFIHLPFHLPSLGLALVWFLLFFILASLLYFALGFLFGLVGFWSRDVWAPRFLFLVFLEFATGALFPLDMLPKTWQTWLPFTPFPYLLFYPLKLFLGQLERPFFYLAMAFFWLLVLALLDLFVWHRGMRRYEAEGR